MNKDRLNRLFKYYPESGELIRATDKNYNAKKGDIVGTIANNGYKVVNVDGKLQLVHRVIMTMIHGDITGRSVDHINGNRLDNRIVNLRVVSQLENNRNSSLPKHNSSGFVGVTWCKQQNQWQAYITLDGKLKKLGRFDCKIDAVAARMNANAKYGFHSNHGKHNA